MKEDRFTADIIWRLRTCETEGSSAPSAIDCETRRSIKLDERFYCRQIHDTCVYWLEDVARLPTPDIMNSIKFDANTCDLVISTYWYMFVQRSILKNVGYKLLVFLDTVFSY